MKKNQRAKSVIKVLIFSFCLTVLSSFSDDPCKPTQSQMDALCEDSPTKYCHYFYTDGPCVNSSYDVLYKQLKHLAD